MRDRTGEGNQHYSHKKSLMLKYLGFLVDGYIEEYRGGGCAWT